jgi:hypothetical protein
MAGWKVGCTAGNVWDVGCVRAGAVALDCAGSLGDWVKCCCCCWCAGGGCWGC